VVLASGDVLLADYLPPPEAARPTAASAPAEPALTTLAEAEKHLIARALRATQGPRGRTCEILGISRPTLERKLRKYRLKAEDPQAH
jgi:two-component system response regulator AtoC